MVKQAEIESIRRACRKISENYSPPITFIICQKRHRVRFFPLTSSSSSRDQQFERGRSNNTSRSSGGGRGREETATIGGGSDRTGNCLPGTLLDSVITHPGYNNFYLLSHPAIQGTSRPIHYYVIQDENNFASQDLQKIIYNMCYNYALCSRAVSIPPAVYYAHKAANHMRIIQASKVSEDGSMVVPEGQSALQINVHADIQHSMYFI